MLRPRTLRMDSDMHSLDESEGLGRGRRIHAQRVGALVVPSRREPQPTTYQA